MSLASSFSFISMVSSHCISRSLVPSHTTPLGHCGRRKRSFLFRAKSHQRSSIPFRHSGMWSEQWIRLYVFFVEIPLIQFGCLLLVCPLLCFFLLFVVVCLLLPDGDTKFRTSFVVHWWVHFPSSFPHTPARYISNNLELINRIMCFQRW